MTDVFTITLIAGHAQDLAGYLKHVRDNGSNVSVQEAETLSKAIEASGAPVKWAKGKALDADIEDAQRHLVGLLVLRGGN